MYCVFFSENICLQYGLIFENRSFVTTFFRNFAPNFDLADEKTIPFHAIRCRPDNHGTGQGGAARGHHSGPADDLPEWRLARHARSLRPTRLISTAYKTTTTAKGSAPTRASASRPSQSFATGT